MRTFVIFNDSSIPQNIIETSDPSLLIPRNSFEITGRSDINQIKENLLSYTFVNGDLFLNNLSNHSI